MASTPTFDFDDCCAVSARGECYAGEIYGDEMVQEGQRKLSKAEDTFGELIGR